MAAHDHPNRSSPPPILVELEMDETQVKMELDTGAAVSIMSKAQWDHLTNSAPLALCNLNLLTYTNAKVKAYGEALVTVCHNMQRKRLPLVIVDGSGPPLLGRNWLQQLKLDWTQLKSLFIGQLRSDLTKKYTDVFAPGLGIMTIEAKLHVDAGATPKFFKSRPVPYALRPAVYDGLDRLESQGILEKVPFSDWATPWFVCERVMEMSDSAAITR